MSIKVQVIFYSLYGRMYKIAEAIAKGAREVNDVTVELFRVPEFLPDEILTKSGAKEAQQSFANVPVLTAQQMNADAFIFGTPVRFGQICTQMRNFLDQLASTWKSPVFAGKVGSVFTAETSVDAAANFQQTLLRLGMMVVGHAKGENAVVNADASYAASILNKRMPSDDELTNAIKQGKQIAEIARDLKIGRNRVC